MKLPELLYRIKVLEERLNLLEQQNTVLRKENAHLRERLSKYEVSKNSRNSSLPPSRDQNRPKPNQSLRKASGKPKGGQPGHKGNTLKMVSHPDTVVDLIPDYCSDCGSSLVQAASSLSSIRQQIDLPPIQPVYTEYRSYSKQCSCGKVCVGDFPTQVKASISYGPTIEGLVSYLHARQYLPYGRMKEVLNDLLHIPISEAGIECLLKRFATKASPVYDLIRQRLSYSKVVGSDETSVVVNGKNHWMWTWQNSKMTYIAHSPNRSKTTIAQHFPKGFPNSVLVSDGWKPQLNTPAMAHQSCIAHLLRKLNYLIERYPQANWASDFQELLYDALELHKQWQEDKQIKPSSRNAIIYRLEKLLQHPPDKKDKQLYTFFKRMLREQQHLFVFLYIENLPPDNNASERAIRNVKVKQKISGQFKNQQTAQNFAVIRSVIDTAIKNGMEILNALALIAKNEAQFTY